MQGSRVNSPSSATLQAPGLPYTCGPYLGFLAATLLLLRGGRRRRIRAARVRAQRWTRVGERCSSVACAISRAEQVALATCREWQRGKTAKAVGGPRWSRSLNQPGTATSLLCCTLGRSSCFERPSRGCEGAGIRDRRRNHPGRCRRAGGCCCEDEAVV